MKWNMKRWVLNGLFAVLLTGSINVYASEADSAPLEDAQALLEKEQELVMDAASAIDAVQVVFPTNNDHMFDFILDPERLISQTNAAAYENRKFEEGATLFFRRMNDTEVDYSNASDTVTIINKGTVSVKATVTAKIEPSSLGDIILTDDREFTDDTNTSIFLALTDGENVIPVEEEEAVLQVSISGEEAQEEKNHTYSFWLTGAANSDGNWRKLTEGAPRVIVSWTLVPEKQDEAAVQADKEEELASLPDTEKGVDEDAVNVDETEAMRIPDVDEKEEPDSKEGDDNALPSDLNSPPVPDEIKDITLPDKTEDTILPDETEDVTLPDKMEENTAAAEDVKATDEMETESPSNSSASNDSEEDESVKNDVNPDAGGQTAEGTEKLLDNIEIAAAETILEQEKDADASQGDNR